MTAPLHLRLEPSRPDLDLGLRARIADPVWFLTRQWQLGEHRGEDASSPVAIHVSATHAPLVYDRARPDLDPTVVPAEALLEAEPGGWWTIGRRVRLGRAAKPLVASEPQDRVAAWRFGVLAPPYEDLAGELDGRAIFLSGVLAGNAIWSEVPSPAPDAWSTSELTHSARFGVAGHALAVRDHDGGDADWFTVDGDGTDPRTTPAPPAPARWVIPGRLDYPGAPHPRWWQIEDHAVDVGGFAPDRSHLATILLYDVALAHSDDWFQFPVPPPPDPSAQPSAGVLVSLSNVVVRDSFDEEWPLAPPPAAGGEAWSLFHTDGLPETQLVIWPVAVAPHRGPLLDDVLIGIDEDANLAWAVELYADGRQLLPDAATEEALAETTWTGAREFQYLPSTTLPPHWHPYQRVRAADPAAPAGSGDGRSGHWRQGIVADLTGELPRPRPGPVSRLVGGPSGAGAGRGHHLDPRAIPSTGVRLQRRAMLARDTDGRPVLWVKRSAQPLLGPPTPHLRFDVLAEEARNR